MSGIETRHSRACNTRTGGRCSCRPTYQASAWSARENKRLRRTFPTLAAARAWRQDAQVAIRARAQLPPSSITIAEAAEVWLEGARAGQIRNRSGDVYKPSAIRNYEQALRLRLLPEIGALPLDGVTRPLLQALIDRMLREGRSASTIRNTMLPLRTIFRRALVRGDVAHNPTAGLELPAVRSRRDRIASPAEAAALLAALPEADRGVWATAFYAGLRLGELRALRWEDVDFDGGVIRVRRSWDQYEGEIDPKSRAGVRDVPIPLALRAHLERTRVLAGRSDGLVFGRSATRPFEPSTLNNRAVAAWSDAKLTPIGLHEARHTYASMMIAAGVNAKALSTYMGHSSVTITFDRYGHLMPGNAEEAAALLDAFLARPDWTTDQR